MGRHWPSGCPIGVWVAGRVGGFPGYLGVGQDRPAGPVDQPFDNIVYAPRVDLGCREEQLAGGAQHMARQNVGIRARATQVLFGALANCWAWRASACSMRLLMYQHNRLAARAGSAPHGAMPGQETCCDQHLRRRKIGAEVTRGRSPMIGTAMADRARRTICTW